MATALCPCLGLGEGPVALDTFFHFKMGFTEDEDELDDDDDAAAEAWEQIADGSGFSDLYDWVEGEDS